MSLRSKVKVNEVSNKLTDMRITIAGRPKVGKTTMFYEILKREGGIDTGLLLAFEKGYTFLPGINVVDINTWEDYVEVVDSLVEDSEGYSFIGFDTVDIAGKLCTEYVLRRQSIKDGKRYATLSDIPFGKAYDLLEAEYQKQQDRLEKAGFGLFFITHDKDKRIEEKSGLAYDKTFMSVSGRVGDIIKNSSDFLVFIDIEKEKVKEGRENKIGESRKIRLRGDGTTEAGGRIVKVPEVIDYDIDLFLQTIYTAVDNQTKSMATIGGDKDVEVEEKPKKAPKPKKNKPKAKEEVEEDSSSELADVIEAITDKVKSMDTPTKKEWAVRFKNELGSMDFTKSDDVGALNKLLSEM